MNEPNPINTHRATPQAETTVTVFLQGRKDKLEFKGPIVTTRAFPTGHNFVSPNVMDQIFVTTQKDPLRTAAKFASDKRGIKKPLEAAGSSDGGSDATINIIGPDLKLERVVPVRVTYWETKSNQSDSDAPPLITKIIAWADPCDMTADEKACFNKGVLKDWNNKPPAEFKSIAETFPCK